MKRMIFTVTTGRSGTGYLATMLSRIPGITVGHEPEPSFVKVMRASQSNPEVAESFWVEKNCQLSKR